VDHVDVTVCQVVLGGMFKRSILKVTMDQMKVREGEFSGGCVTSAVRGCSLCRPGTEATGRLVCDSVVL
jgi:hypothetical protein